MIKLFLSSLLVLIAAMTSSFAKEIKKGDLLLKHPTLRATAPGAKVGGGYVTITNTGNEADRLVGGSAAYTGKVEIHEMKMENDVMKMSSLNDGLEIPAGETVKLVPGGYHIMLMKLADQLKEGEMRKLTLTFEKAGTFEIDFHVKSIADTMKMKKKHSH